MQSGPPPSDPRTQAILADYAVLEGGGLADHGPPRLVPLPDEFDGIVGFAAMLCDAPTAFVSFVGDEMQWFGAKTGLTLDSTMRDVSFCAFAMVQTEALIVPDARLDARFSNNALVTGEPFIRFYAGAPLRSPEGIPLGALCVLDDKPHPGLTETQKRGLETLAGEVMARLESRRRAAWRARVQATIVGLTAESGFAHVLDVDLKDLRVSGQGGGAQWGHSLQGLLDSVLPDDLPGLRDALRTARTDRTDLRAEFRVVQRTGAERRMLLRARVIGDAAGAERLVGVVTDVTDQWEAERARVEGESRFRVLADTMPQMVWSTRADGFHDYYNARWYEFTGTPPGSTDGEGWNDMFHADDQERAWSRWRHSLETGEPYEIEYRLRHHSGLYRWVLGRALPMRDETGAIVRWFGTCTDIHDARQAAEERELVAQELSHRIKNTFLVISGLIGLHARNDPAVRPFADEMRERIAALGRAHNFVRPHSRRSRPSTGSTTLHGLIGDLVAPYQSAGSSRITVTGDNLTVDDRAATPLALLVHELATNAVKYGALSQPTGQVAIKTTLDAARLSLAWDEGGGPKLGDHVPPDGFGTRICRLSVEAQMGGTLSKDWRPEGLRLKVVIPRQSIEQNGARTSLVNDT